MADFSHFDEQGRSRMVDVDDKPETDRTARASGQIEMLPETLTRIQEMKVSKGNVFEVARLAGIMSAKKTPDLIPLCHPIQLSKVAIDFQVLDETTIKIVSEIKLNGKTGAEMEALTASIGRNDPSVLCRGLVGCHER